MKIAKSAISCTVICVLFASLAAALVSALSGDWRLSGYLMLTSHAFLLFLACFYTPPAWYMLPMFLLATQGARIGEHLSVQIPGLVWFFSILSFPFLLANAIREHQTRRHITQQRHIIHAARSPVIKQISFFWPSWLLNLLQLCFCVYVFSDSSAKLLTTAVGVGFGALFGTLISLISGKYRWALVLLASPVLLILIARLLHLPILPTLGSMWISGYVVACLSADSSTLSRPSQIVLEKKKQFQKRSQRGIDREWS